MQNRTVDLHIRLTEKEASELKRKAKMCRITQSALVRILINGYEPRQAEAPWRLENEIEKEFLRPKESKLKYK